MAMQATIMPARAMKIMFRYFISFAPVPFGLDYKYIRSNMNKVSVIIMYKRQNNSLLRQHSAHIVYYNEKVWWRHAIFLPVISRIVCIQSNSGFFEIFNFCVAHSFYPVMQVTPVIELRERTLFDDQRSGF